MKMRTSVVFSKNDNCNKRIVANQGSTRSTKTTSLAQVFIKKMITEQNKIFTITRKTGPALKATVQKDFFDLLKLYNLYSDDYFNKGDQIYRLNGNEVNFISLDQSAKLKGRKHNYVWMNEADECEYQDFLQLNLRLSNPSNDGKINQLFADYNPAYEYHWIDDHVLSRSDCEFIHSTYKDNTFLDKETVRIIEALKESDPESWKIYGLGIKAASGDSIFTNWEIIDEMPKDCNEYTYGLDFGFTHPLALVEIGFTDDALYWDLMLYEKALTTPELIKRLNELIIKPDKYIFADGSRPETIRQILESGFNIMSAEKDVLEGIKAIKAKKLYITARSTDLIKELKTYKWKKTKDGRVLEEPVKLFDDAIDAGRYGSFSHLKGMLTGRPQFTFIKR